MSATFTSTTSSTDAHFECIKNNESNYSLICKGGQDLGVEFRVSAGENVIGRVATASIKLTDELVSRHHVRLYCSSTLVPDEKGGCYLEDLGSRNGTLLNGALVEGVHRLNPGDLIRIGNTELQFAVRIESHPALDSISPQNCNDQPVGNETPSMPIEAVTGDFRIDFHRVLQHCYAESRETGVTFSLLYIDIDDLDAVNQLHGHSAGDQAILHLRELLQSCCGPTHGLTRYHGDEFTLLLRQTDGHVAYTTAEKMRAAVEANPYKALDNATIHLTVSIGGTEIKLSDSPESIFQTAKSNAITARRRGGNRVVYS